MRKRGIIIGGMVIGLLMGCNNGGEDPQKVFLKSVVSLGNDFLTVFTSFGDMLGDVLGFNEKTTKSKVGEYFNKIHDTVQGTKTSLNKIVSDMKEKGNPNYSATESEVNKLIKEKLDKIIEGARTASDAIGIAGEELLGNIAANGAGGDSAHGAGAKEESVENLVKGIKTIVDLVLGTKGSADAGDDKKATDGSQRTSATPNNGEAAKLFIGAGNAGANADAKKSATDAAKAVGAVTGVDILKAIIQDGGDASKLAKNNGGSVNTTGIAKDGTIAGGIALRAMAKGGKFANASDSDGGIVAPIVKGAAVSAVTKALDTLTIAIRKTIDEGLKTVKDAMKINPEDAPVINESNTANNK